MTFDMIKVPLFYPDGRRKGLLVIGRDITDRKRAEQQLKSAYEDLEKIVQERTAELAKAENTLQAILDTAPIGVLMAEASTRRITYMSRSARKILGEDASTASFDIDPPAGLMFRPDGSPFPAEELPMRRSLRTGESVHNVEVLVHRRDGDILTTLIGSAPVMDSKGTSLPLSPA